MFESNRPQRNWHINSSWDVPAWHRALSECLTSRTLRIVPFVSLFAVLNCVPRVVIDCKLLALEITYDSRIPSAVGSSNGISSAVGFSGFVLSIVEIKISSALWTSWKHESVASKDRFKDLIPLRQNVRIDDYNYFGGFYTHGTLFAPDFVQDLG